MSSSKSAINCEDFENIDLDNIEPELLQELTSKIKTRILYYVEENTKLQTIMSKLKLVNDELKLDIESSDALDKLCEIQEKFESLEMSANAVGLSEADRMRKHKKYFSKLKICNKMYSSLNERLCKDIKSVRRDLEHGNTKVDEFIGLTPQELDGLEKKISRYENQIATLEKKYPWLKNPEFDLTNIMKEAAAWSSLKEEKEKLKEELSVYRGLKPNLKEAAEQLKEIKRENQQLQGTLYK